MALGWRSQYYRYRGFFLNVVSLYKQRAELRAFTEVALSIATITIFLLFALKPTALTIIELAKEIGEKKATIASLDQKISDLREAASVYQQNQNLFPSLDIAISNKPKPDTITRQVEGLAAKNSVSLLGLSVGQVTLLGDSSSTKKSSELTPLPEDSLEMPIAINIQGDYPNLTAFITDLENLRIVSKVDSISVGSSEVNENKVIVALISARIPYLKDKIVSAIK